MRLTICGALAIGIISGCGEGSEHPAAPPASVAPGGPQEGPAPSAPSGEVTVSDPVPSNEGEIVVFAAKNGGRTDICVMNIDLSALTNLTESLQAGTENVQPSFSPDGKRIVFVSNAANTNRELYVMAVDGTAVTRLTTDPEREHAPRFSPDGSRIVFARGGRTDLFIIDAKGGAETKLTSTNQANEWEPAWAPDGSRVAFVSDRDGNREIYVMNADGTGTTRLTVDPDEDEHPTFNEAGDQILFVSRRSGNREIYTMALDGTGVTKLTNERADDLESVYAPKSGSILFSSRRDGLRQLYQMAPDGALVTRITQSATEDQWPHVAFGVRIGIK